MSGSTMPSLSPITAVSRTLIPYPSFASMSACAAIIASTTSLWPAYVAKCSAVAPLDRAFGSCPPLSKSRTFRASLSCAASKNGFINDLRYTSSKTYRKLIMKRVLPKMTSKSLSFKTAYGAQNYTFNARRRLCLFSMHISHRNSA